ncbi:MAG: hypothetical protein SGILL_005389 [Bacillariaceae sp.]
MAYVAAGGGILATVTVWLFVLTPMPVSFLWPGVMLPALLAAFLSEGSKFLFLDTAICRNTVWFPPGADSSPRIASGCSLGVTGKLAIAAASIFFFSLVVVCLRSPERRDLELYYGMEYTNGDHPETSDDDNNDTGSERDHRDSLAMLHPDIEEVASEFTITSRGYDSDFGGVTGFSVSGSTRGDEDDSPSHQVNSRDEKHRRNLERSIENIQEEGDDRYNPKKTPRTTAETKCTQTPDNADVSESRLSTVQKLEKNAAALQPQQALIDKFVSEFNASFDRAEAEMPAIDEREEPEFPITI